MDHSLKSHIDLYITCIPLLHMGISFLFADVVVPNSGGSPCADVLTCGVCQKDFLLADILRFIQHKVHCQSSTSSPNSQHNRSTSDESHTSNTTEETSGLKDLSNISGFSSAGNTTNNTQGPNSSSVTNDGSHERSSSNTNGSLREGSVSPILDPTSPGSPDNNNDTRVRDGTSAGTEKGTEPEKRQEEKRKRDDEEEEGVSMRKKARSVQDAEANTTNSGKLV